MAYTEEDMKHDDDCPGGILRQTVLVDAETRTATIRILVKNGYSWVDTGLGVIVYGYQFVVTDLE